MALANNPQAALLFWWPTLKRQIRVEGTTAKIPAAQSDRYFQSRPRQSQLSALGSQQSAPLASRTQLMKRLEQLQAQWENQQSIPRPDYWGGYCLQARHYEFWQEGNYRLHDRIAYDLVDDQWRMQRLSP